MNKKKMIWLNEDIKEPELQPYLNTGIPMRDFYGNPNYIATLDFDQALKMARIFNASYALMEEGILGLKGADWIYESFEEEVGGAFNKQIIELIYLTKPEYCHIEESHFED